MSRKYLITESEFESIRVEGRDLVATRDNGTPVNFGQVVPDISPEMQQLLDDTEAARDQAEVFSATTVELQDTAVAQVFNTPGSASNAALTEAVSDEVAAQNIPGQVASYTTAQVPPLVADAIAEDNTVVLAAASAVTAEIAGRDLIESTVLTTENLNSVTTPGMYFQPTAGNVSLARNYPLSGGTWVLEVKAVTASHSIVLQRITLVVAGTKNAQTWERRLSSAGGEWVFVGTGFMSLSTENLNELMVQGKYGQASPANATVERNYPMQSATGVITVEAATESTLLMTFTAFPSASRGFATHVFQRVYVGGAWSAWQSLSGVRALGTAHLDTVREHCVMFQQQASNATLERGYPLGGVAGVLEVLPAFGVEAPLSWLQRFTVVSLIAGTPVKQFHRVLPATGVPTEWIEGGSGGGTLTIGTVSTGAGSSASIVDGELNLVLQRGVEGPVGPPGMAGPVGPASPDALPAAEAVATWLNDSSLDVTAKIERLSLSPAYRTSFGEREVLTRFQPGHDWTLTGAGMWGIGVSAFTDSAATLTTDGAGGIGVAETYFAGKDLSEGAICVWVKASDAEQVALFQVQLQTDGSWTNYWSTQIASNEDRLPVRDDRWIPFVLEPGFGNPNFVKLGTNPTGFDNITGIRLRMQDKATGSVQFILGGVELISKPARFPDGAIIIGFDDCYLSQKLARNLMDEYGYPGTHYVIKEALGATGVNDFLTLQDLKDMQYYSGWDVQHHAYSSAVHAATYPGVSAAVLDRDLREGKRWGKQQGFDYEHLAYPQGQFDENVIEVVKKYFVTARTTVRHPRAPSGPYRPYEVGGEIVRGNTSASVTLAQQVEHATKSGIPTEFIFHRFEEGTGVSSDSIGYTTGRFREFLDIVKTSGVEVITRAEAYAR